MINNREIGKGEYGTHLVPLIAAVLATKGDVLELGIGDFSTPVLHEILKHTHRNFISVENDPDWFKNFYDLDCDKHFIWLLEYNDSILDKNFSVVFVDNAPAENRIKAIELFKDKSEIIVVHDTDKMIYYGYGPVFLKFKYVKTYTRYRKSTTLLSNSIDVIKLL